MRGAYLFAPTDSNMLGSAAGVERKVKSQVKVLSKEFDCTLVSLPAPSYLGSLKERIVRRLPFTASWRKWSYRDEFDGLDFLYIRMVDHDDSFVRYLRKIKSSNPDIKIIYEIPTFPYGVDEKLTISNCSFYIKERLCRKKAAHYFDRIVTFYGQDSIWDVPCIKLMNGFDFGSVQLPKREKPESINIISVSTTAFWHGYDRFIEGLHEYYIHGGTENIQYHVVGNVLPKISEMVHRYALEDHVILHGLLSGEELAEVYRLCLLGIDILGGHRRDYPISSTLKSREYGAWGLPLITSSPVDYLPNDYPYQLLVPYDESPIQINDVIRYYHSIYDEKTCDAVAKSIRDYSEKKCDMSVTMKPVIEFLRS